MLLMIFYLLMIEIYGLLLFYLLIIITALLLGFGAIFKVDEVIIYFYGNLVALVISSPLIDGLIVA